MIKTWKIKNEGNITTELYIIPLIVYVNRITSRFNTKTKMTIVETIRGISIGWIIWTWFISFPKIKKLSNKIISNIMKKE